MIAPVNNAWIIVHRFSENLDIQHIFVDIVCIVFYPNGVKNEENAEKFEVLKRNMVFTEPKSTELIKAQQHYVESSYIKFHPE